MQSESCVMDNFVLKFLIIKSIVLVVDYY